MNPFPVFDHAPCFLVYWVKVHGPVAPFLHHPGGRTTCFRDFCHDPSLLPPGLTLTYDSFRFVSKAHQRLAYQKLQEREREIPYHDWVHTGSRHAIVLD